jgi:putative PIN family toxin of toxin-antitoxin system
MPWELLRLAEAGEVELCMATAMLVELAEVLSYERFQPRLEQISLTPAELMAYVISLASIFDVPEGDPIVTDDPDDDVFIHCAIAAGAGYLVSGDHHLLDLGEYADIPILTVREFLAQVFPHKLN